MQLINDRGDIEAIDREECVHLLATQVVGRIAFINGGAPDVLPVNYIVDGDAIVFATAAGSKLWGAERGPVAFEVTSDDAVLTNNQALAIGIIVNELVTNSLKYAFPDNRPGHVTVRLRAAEENCTHPANSRLGLEIHTRYRRCAPNGTLWPR